MPALGLKTNVLFHALMLGLLRLPISIDRRAPAGALRLRAGAAAGGALLRARRRARRARRWRCCCCRWSGAGSPSRGSTTTCSRCRRRSSGWGSSRATAAGPGRPRRFALALAAVVVFLAHAVTFAVLLLVTAIRILWPGDGTRLSLAGRLRNAGPATLALAPALILQLVSWRGLWGSHLPPEPTLSRWEMYDFPSAVGSFFVEFAVRFHLADLAALGPPLVVLIAVPLAARRAASVSAPRWPLLAALVLAILYLVSPHIVFGSDLAPRLRPLIVFALLCYGGVVLSPRARRRVTLLALVSGLGRRGAPGPELPQPRPRAGRLRLGDPLRAPREPRLPGHLRSPLAVDPGQAVPARLGLLRPRPRRRHPLRVRLARDAASLTATASCPLHHRDSPFPSDAEDEPYALIEGRLCAADTALLPLALLRRRARAGRGADRRCWGRRTTTCSPGRRRATSPRSWPRAVTDCSMHGRPGALRAAGRRRAHDRGDRRPTPTFMNRYVRLLGRHDLAICVAALVLFVVALATAARLRLRSDFRELLPQDDPELKSLQQIGDRIGARSTLVIAVEGPDPGANERFADALVANLQPLVGRRAARDRRPPRRDARRSTTRTRSSTPTSATCGGPTTI